MLAFIHIEKGAGTTLFHMLRRTFGTAHCDVELWDDVPDFDLRGSRCFSATDYRKLRILYPRLRSIGGHSVRPYSDLESVAPVKYWTFVREPMARCASHYQFQVQKMGVRISFEEWIRKEQYRNFMTKKIAGRDDLDLALEILREKLVFVGVVEKFAESIALSRSVLNWRGGQGLESKNVSLDDRIKNSLLEDGAALGLLREANELDLQLYEYVVEELFPAQRAQLNHASPTIDIENSHWATRCGDMRERLNLMKRKHVYKRALRYYRRWYSCTCSPSP